MYPFQGVSPPNMSRDLGSIALNSPPQQKDDSFGRGRFAQEKDERSGKLLVSENSSKYLSKFTKSVLESIMGSHKPRCLLACEYWFILGLSAVQKIQFTNSECSKLRTHQADRNHASISKFMIRPEIYHTYCYKLATFTTLFVIN